MNTLSMLLKREDLVRSAAFVARCALAAAMAYQLAALLHLSMPVWASISALVIAQEKWRETQTSLYERIHGTSFGVAISLSVYLVATPFHVSAIIQLMIAVAICAAIARVDRGLRVCMWTCPIVLMSGHMGGEPVLARGLYRALEIVIGGIVGTALHFLAERLLAAWQARRA
jgi:uncharacterized membrane protein YgaE (UPF0421/DUF939 family)